MYTKKTAFQAILKNLLRAFLAVALASAAVFFISNQISGITKSIVEKKAAGALLQKRSLALASLRTALAQIDGNDAKIDAALPPDDNVTPFVTALQSIATQASTKETVELNTPVATPITAGATTLSRINFTATLDGTAVTLIQYLKSFETLPYFAGVSSIGITAPGGWDGNSVVSISAFVYAKQSTL